MVRTPLVLCILALLPTSAMAQPPDAAAPADEAPSAGSEPPDATVPEETAADETAPPPADTDDPPARVAYDKGFTLTSADDAFSLRAGIRSQARLEVERPEADDEVQAHFVIPRLRLQLEGHAFGEATTYKVEFDMAGRGAAVLKDFYVDRVLVPGVHARIGQWKRPFSRHEIISDFAGEFLERSIANSFGGAGRDLGVAVHNGYERSPDGLEWALGVFNGTGDRPVAALDCDDPADATTCTPGTPTNVPGDIGPMLVARVGWNLGGIKGYSEGDLEGGPLRAAVGASYKVDLADLEEDAAGDLQLEQAAEIDALVKIAGFDLQGAVYLVKSGQADPELGFLGQAGFFVVPATLQLAGRYSLVPEGDDETVQEVMGAIDWYFQGHGFKWMTDAGALLSSAGQGATDLLLRTQIQLVF